MFGKNNWSDRLQKRLTAYIDERFEEYRERLAEDLARGVAQLGQLLSLLAILLLVGLFLSLTLTLLLAGLLWPLLGAWALVLAFGLMAIGLSAGGYYLWKNRTKLVHSPIFEQIHQALLGESKEAKDLAIEEEIEIEFPTALSENKEDEQERNEQ